MCELVEQSKGKITDLLEGILGDIYAIEKQPAPRVIDNLDSCVAACAQALTRIKRLRRWVRMELEDGVPLEGCPTDEEMRLMQDASDQEQIERDAWYKERGMGKDWEAAGWSEGRGYGDFPEEVE